LCGSEKLEAVVSFPDSPAGDLYKEILKTAVELPKFPLGCNLCIECGHVQLSYFVDPELIYSEYIYVTSDSLGLDQHFQSYADDLLSYIRSDTPKTILEIGCNDGTLLEKLCQAGNRGIGLDPAEYPLRIAAGKGLTVVQDYFSTESSKKIMNSYGSMDVIIANNVLANVENLNEVFECFREIISTDGVIVFETGYLEHIVTKKVIDNIHHEHIDYFSVTPLIRFLKKFDLYIDRLIINESKGSSIRVFAKLGPTSLTPASVSAVAFSEVSDGYFELSSYADLNLEIDRESLRIKKFIELNRTLGRQVVGYGAAIGSTTLILALDLENEFDYLVDDNPRRAGKYSPGAGIPVKNVGELSNAECAVIILAWRYEKSISPKISQISSIKSVTSIWAE
jgi:SAM-dependent methyltransferase